MLEKIAYSVSKWDQKKIGFSEIEREAVEYGTVVLLDSITKFFVLCVVGCVSRRLEEFIITLIAFCGLRYWAGGIHCKTRNMCTLAMVGVCFLGAVGVVAVEYIQRCGSVITWVACILAIFLKVPGETGKTGFLSENERIKRKTGAMLYCIILCIFYLTVSSMRWKGAVIIGTVAEVFSILPCKRNKYNAVKGEKNEE